MRRLGFLVLVTLSACGGTEPIGELASGLSVCAQGPLVQGVDVSHYDGTISWPMAKAAGIDFVIMKATESTDFTDPTFATNWKAAGDAGLIRGAYHFFRASADAVKQADFFLQTIGTMGPGDLPPTIDLETLDGVSPSAVGTDALAFLQRIEQQTGLKPIVYTSASFLSSINSPAGFGAYTLWVANWQVKCPSIPAPPWSDWAFWQNSSTGTVSGIASQVDVDQFNGTLTDLQMLAGAGPAGAGDGGAATGTDGGEAMDGGTGAPTGSGDMAPATDGGDRAGAPTPQVLTQGGCSFAGPGSGTSPWLLCLLLLSIPALRRRARFPR